MSKPIDELKTAADFREFFMAIPDEKWLTGKFANLSGCMCARGHLGDRPGGDRTAASWALHKILGDAVVGINDGEDERYPQKTPRARIIAALDDKITGAF